MATRIADGMYLMSEPLTDAQWMVRLITPGKIQAVSRDSNPEIGNRVTSCLNRGYTFTPLIAATPERREALEKLITRGKNHFMQGAWTAGHNFVAISEMEEPTEIVIMREMLAEMEEGNDDQP